LSALIGGGSLLNSSNGAAAAKSSKLKDVRRPGDCFAGDIFPGENVSFAPKSSVVDGAVVGAGGDSELCALKGSKVSLVS
jgi:hypothetical protein